MITVETPESETPAREAPAREAPEREMAGYLLANLVHFGRLLRRLGLPITATEMATAAAALGCLDLERRREVKAGLRAVLAGRREHLELFDRAFDAFWREGVADAPPSLELGQMIRRGRQVNKQLLGLVGGDPDRLGGEEEGETVLEPHFAASHRELLRRKDFAELTAEEEAAVRELIRRQSFPLPPRRTRRREPARRGDALDLRRTLRRSLRHGGEPLELARRRRKAKPRPLVALCDVSGSMEPYARLLLQFLYALGPGSRQRGAGRREIFAFGTRLTRLTRHLDRRDPDLALQEAAAAVVDWGGGTRIGEALRHFNLHWARRVLGQGAVVLLISDGWERGEPELLARELDRLRRSCERLIWLNPLLGVPGYEPLTRGIQAALPYLDEFLPVHNLRSLEQLGRVLTRLGASPSRPPSPRQGGREQGRPGS